MTTIINQKSQLSSFFLFFLGQQYVLLISKTATTHFNQQQQPINCNSKISTSAISQQQQTFNNKRLPFGLFLYSCPAACPPACNN
jgi:hypothetical protein